MDKKAYLLAEAKPITQYTDAAQYLELPEFCRKHGKFFLVGPISPLNMPDGPQETMKRNVRVSVSRLLEERSDLLIFPVRSTGRSTSIHITIGRTKNNDIVVPDVSVSKFHAFIRIDEQNRPFLQDAGSKNGTVISGRPVPARGDGKAMELRSGTRVRFGSVEFAFQDAEHFRDLVTTLGRPT